MLTTIVTALPIFALILAGWAAGRAGLLGNGATGALNRFVVVLALPALLFDIVATASWDEVWQPRFIGAFGGAMMLVFALVVAIRLRQRQGGGIAAIDGLNAAYANTGFLGFPLLLALFGEASLAPVLIASILTVCVLFAIAVMMVEAGSNVPSGGSPALRLAKSMATNPLLIAPAAGLVVLLAGTGLPVPVERTVDLLGAAAAPCALVALGLFLADQAASQSKVEVKPADVALLTVSKLVLQPALTWALAAHVFALPHVLTVMAVIIAALPTGTGSFMLAEYHGLEASLTARTVLVTTVVSLASVALWMALLG